MVDDLEIAAAGQFLELDEGEIGLDAGGVAVHDQPDGAGRRDHRNLGVAVAVLLAQFQRPVPYVAGGPGQFAVRAIGRFQRHRVDRQVFVTGLGAHGGAAVVANDLEHGLAVVLVMGKGAHFGGHFRRRGIGLAAHQRRDGAAKGPPSFRIIGNASRHQIAADVGEAQAQGAVFVAQFGDPVGRELGHHHRYLKGHGPQSDGVLESVYVEAFVFVGERHQVQGRQIACRVVQEHVFRTRVRRIDAAAFGARVPIVDGGVELQARIGRSPGGATDLFPKVPGPHPFLDLSIGAPDQVPFAVLEHFFEESVVDPDRVVGILSRHGQIGLGIPIGVVFGKLDFGISLAGELDHPLHVVFRNHRPAAAENRLFQGRVLLQIEAVLAFAFLAGGHDFAQVLAGQLRAGDQCGDFLFFLDLPVDELLDVGMVDVDYDHLGGAPRRAAGLNGAGGAIADLQEAHQPRRLTAARKAFVFGPQGREIGAGAGPVLEQPCLADPQVHDAALVDQVVGNALDEARMGLRALVGRARLDQVAGLVINVGMALGRAVDAVGPVKTGVEPLRRVGSADLGGQHISRFVVIGAGVLLGIEIAAFPAPIGPGAGHAVEYLPRAGFAAHALVLGQLGEAGDVGDAPPQPTGNVIFLEFFQ